MLISAHFRVHAAHVDLKRIMATAESIVFVIDDDPSFRWSTEMLIGSAGFRVQTFSSAKIFAQWASTHPRVCCLMCVCPT